MSFATTANEPLHVRLRRFLAPPGDFIESYLIANEQVILKDSPALKAFVVEELPTIAFTVLIGIVAILWGRQSGNLLLAGMAMIGAGSLLLYLQAKRWSQRYTAYVLTTARVMRVSGVFRRTAAWIPWVKVTDVRFDATFIGRILGYATIYIDSANETSGLSEMKNLHDPHKFYFTLTELVQVKQGYLPSAQSALLHE